jgi:hypothetical protein
MEKTKPLHRTFASMALIAFAAGFSDYVFLDRPEDTASTTQSKSIHVAYQKQSRRAVLEKSGEQRKLKVAQNGDDTSLRRDPNPGWRPVNFLWYPAKTSAHPRHFELCRTELSFLAFACC